MPPRLFYPPIVSDTLTTLDEHVKERNYQSDNRWQVDPLKLSIHVHRRKTDKWNSVRLDDILCDGKSDRHF